MIYSFKGLTHLLSNYDMPKAKITKRYRLRNVNMGHFDSYFNVECWHNSEKHGYDIKVVYLPNILSDPRKIYYKSSTKKAGDFIAIKDICEKHGIPDPDNNQGYKLDTIYRDDTKGMGMYFLPQ